LFQLNDDGQNVTMTMWFFLPKRFTLVSAPKPRDERVLLMLMQEQRFAVPTFSGSRNQQVLFARE
jgi:hypothetical protein